MLLPDVRQVMLGLVWALEHVHETLHATHLDIKSENILVRGNSQGNTIRQLEQAPHNEPLLLAEHV